MNPREYESALKDLLEEAIARELGTAEDVGDL